VNAVVSDFSVDGVADYLVATIIICGRMIRGRRRG
jgi:hypothetical protein